ncbi:MAG: glycosyltransferase family 39 protein [Rhodothermales bacterium]
MSALPYGLSPAFLAVLGLAITLRVGVAVVSGPGWFPIDTSFYLEQGRQIAAGTPHAYLPNGFPLLIAGFWAALSPQYVPTAVLWLNVCASIGTVVVVYAIGCQVADRSTGALSALVVAVYPNQLNFARMLMSEATATFLLVSALYLLLRHRALWSGLVLSLAVLVRTSLLPVVPALLVVILAFRRSRREAVAFVLGAMLVAGLQAVLLTAGTIVPPQNVAYNVLLSIDTVSSDGVDFTQASFQARFSEEEQERPFTTYFRFAVENPRVFLKQRLSAMWELWGPWPSSGDPRHPRRPLSQLLIGLRFLLIVPATWALARHRREAWAWVLAAPVLLVTVVHVSFFSTPRFTHVVEPAAAVLAASLAVELLARSRWGQSRWGTPLNPNPP